MKLKIFHQDIDRTSSRKTPKALADIYKSLQEKSIETQIFSESDASLFEKSLQNFPKDTVLFSIVEYLIQSPGCRFWIHEALEYYAIPFVGSSSKAIQLSLDKHRLKEYCNIFGVAVPEDILIEKPSDAATIPFRGPYIVKPNDLGASQGVSRKETTAEARDYAILLLENLHHPVIIEQFIGTDKLNDVEFTVGMLGNQNRKYASLKFGFSDTKTNFLTEKVKSSDSEQMEMYALQDDDALFIIAKKVFSLIGARDYARADFRKDENGKLFLTETNLLPGTGRFGYFAEMMNRTYHLSYGDVLEQIVRSAAERHHIK